MTRSMFGRAASVLLAIATWTAACGKSSEHDQFTASPDGGHKDGSATSMLGGEGGSGGDGSALNPIDGAAVGEAGAGGCGPSTTDLTGCNCPTVGGSRPCYPNNVDPGTSSMGTCKQGTQTCQSNGEFGVWGSCVGSVTPTNENCAGMVDTNCNGKVGCADPSCATDPTCMTGCTNGQMRSCYDGPAGTENVGLCTDGTQVCQNGQWPTNCPGEVLPSPTENCCDAYDHNCNGLPGCFDFLSCFTNSCCSLTCTSSSAVSPGCSCPTGSGDEGTCPMGDHLVGIPNTLQQQCCPCTANDCDDINCCPYDVCSTTSSCSGIMCMSTTSLPASCNGQVSTDCDDWPEDCDEPCCLCASCPEGANTPGAGQ